MLTTMPAVVVVVVLVAQAQQQAPPQAPEGQVGDVVIKYLTDHPEQRRHAAAALVFSALKGAFPCPTN